MKARRAKPSDAPAICRLISHYAKQGLLLPRAEEEIRRNISHFLVNEDKGRVLGCVALERYGQDLAEIRSLAVDPEIRGRGRGVRLLEFALAEARRIGVAKLFAVTHAPEFFARQGFTPTPRPSLTEKIHRDCCTCPKQGSCELTAMIATVIPAQVAFPLLGDSAAPVSAA
jgi:N-acetylglutamate synthase-like GNAT family acetyltransferase